MENIQIVVKESSLLAESSYLNWASFCLDVFFLETKNIIYIKIILVSIRIFLMLLGHIVLIAPEQLFNIQKELLCIFDKLNNFD